jgi:thymidine kinase
MQASESDEQTVYNSSIELHLVMGPMFAGKTTNLINKVNELIQKGVPMTDILLVNHSRDSRYNIGKICSHNGLVIDSYSMENLYQLDMTLLNNCLPNKKYLFIDEGQFFADLYDTVLNIMKLFKKEKCNLAIYIFGLDGDFQQKPFSNGSKLLELIPYCNSITKLQSKCYICNAPAPFSKRLISSNLQILVGGTNMYQPSCWEHL